MRPAEAKVMIGAQRKFAELTERCSQGRSSKPLRILAYFAGVYRAGELGFKGFWRAMPDDDEHYVYATAL